MSAEDKPYKDREEVKKDIRLCALVGGILIYTCIGLAALGVISDALDRTLVLESMSWFLLAIVVGVISILPNMTSLAAKHLYGIESERKDE